MSELQTRIKELEKLIAFLEKDIAFIGDIHSWMQLDASSPNRTKDEQLEALQVVHAALSLLKEGKLVLADYKAELEQLKKLSEQQDEEVQRIVEEYEVL